MAEESINLLLLARLFLNLSFVFSICFLPFLLCNGLGFLFLVQAALVDLFRA